METVKEELIINKRYYNKFSFGISLNISISDYKKIIRDYLPYISSVYFSLPYGKEFHTRKMVIEEYEQENAKEKLIEILKLFKEHGVKLEAVINQYNIEASKVKEGLKQLDQIIKVDSICCLDEYYDIIRKHYGQDMYMISSFNNKPLYKENLDKQLNKLKKYDMLVLSKEFMRDISSLKKVREKEFDIKILINNGCSFNCSSCRNGSEECKKIFKNNLRYHSPEELYALQSLFPWELNKLIEKSDEKLINEIKLSNRPCTYEYLNNCLKSYIYHENEKEYIDKTSRNYHLWGRQANLIPYMEKFNLDNINRIKKTLWSKKD